MYIVLVLFAQVFRHLSLRFLLPTQNNGDKLDFVFGGHSPEKNTQDCI